LKSPGDAVIVSAGKTIMAKFWTAFGLMFLWLTMAATALPPRNAAAADATANDIAANIAAASNAASPAPALPQSGNITEAYRAFPDLRSADCYREPNHDVADLCAQWRATIAAEASAASAQQATIATMVGAAMSTLSFVMVVFALNDGRKSLAVAQQSAADANRAADYQEAQLKLAQDVSRAELQPYVHTTRAVLHVYEDDARLPKVLVTFENSGRTPAIHAECHSRLDAADALDALSYQPISYDSPNEVGVIPPDQRRDRYEPLLYLKAVSQKRTKLKKTDEHGGRFVLRGYIRYRDTFGNRFITEYCYVVSELVFDGETKMLPVHMTGATYRRVDENDVPIGPIG
jgi:hypothetical protein